MVKYVMASCWELQYFVLSHDISSRIHARHLWNDSPREWDTDSNNLKMHTVWMDGGPGIIWGALETLSFEI